MNAWIGHLLTALVIGGALAGVYSKLTAQLAVMQNELKHLKDRPTMDVAAHDDYCQRHCPVRKKHDREEWRETTRVRAMPTSPHGNPVVGGQ